MCSTKGGNCSRYSTAGSGQEGPAAMATLSESSARASSLKQQVTYCEETC